MVSGNRIQDIVRLAEKWVQLILIIYLEAREMSQLVKYYNVSVRT